MTRESNRELILKVSFTWLIFCFLGEGSIGPCMEPLENIAVYEGDLNTFIRYPASPNGAMWSTAATTNELIRVYIVNNDDTVVPSYAADYAYDSSGLTIKNATTSAEAGHKLSTAGLYTVECGGNQSSVKFLVVPLPISVGPLFGPVAGGTNITIIIGSSTIDYITKHVGSYIPIIRDVRNVYVGNDLSSNSVSLLPNDSSTFELVAVTPSTTEASVGQPLPIIIEFSPTPFNMTFNTMFTYLPNPEITALHPTTFITSGGTFLDVFGRSLSSVAKPIIQLTVVLTRYPGNNYSTSNISTTSTTRICTVLPGNDTYMQCPMPPLNLPGDFLEILNPLYNTSSSRREQNINSSDANVLTVSGPNGTDRAVIYLGIIFDGYKEYENINDRLPDTKFIFYSAPEIKSSNEVIEFDPSEDEVIYVKGRYMLRGCRLRDYVVHIANQICINGNLTDNELSCRPPKEKATSTMNDPMRCGQHLSITITVGYKQYQYACLTYPDNSKTFALIVGLTIGLVGFALFLTILIACIVRRRRKNVNQENERHQNSGGQELRNQHYNNEVQPESQQDYNTRIYTRQNTISIYTPNDEYFTSLDEFDSNS